MNDLESQRNDDNVVKTVVLGATCPTQPNRPLTVMAKHHVRPETLHVFAKWCREIQQRSRKFDGYLDTEIIRPTCCIKSDEYVVIFRFNNYDNLQTWMESKERKQMIDRIPEFSSTNSVVYAYHSLEHWFASSDEEETSQDATKPAGGGAPPKYKMVVVTTAIIYTQTLWVPKVLNKMLTNANLHPDVMGLLAVFCIVCLATYVLFPIVTRLLAFWLFPSANYRDKLMELVPSYMLSTKHEHPSSSRADREQPNKGDSSSSDARIGTPATSSLHRGDTPPSEADDKEAPV